jgi:hypothetical protein
MDIENLVQIANWLDKRAAAGEGDAAALKIAANAIDMAIQEGNDPSDPFDSAVKCLLVYANILDADGQTNAVGTIDAVLETMATKIERTAAATSAREELYNNEKHRKDTMFNALMAEIEKVEPIHEGLGGHADTLATRNSPDHPGVMMLRISDGVYQDIMSKKIYDFNKGWVDEKGNKQSGGSVAHQTPIYNQYLYMPQIFESRHLVDRPK